MDAARDRALDVGRKNHLGPALRARDQGGGALLHADRVGEARRGEPKAVPTQGHAARDRDARHRHPATRAARGVVFAAAPSPVTDPSSCDQTCSREHLRSRAEATNRDHDLDG